MNTSKQIAFRVLSEARC